MTLSCAVTFIKFLRMHWEITGIDIAIESSETINHAVCLSSTSGMKDSGMEEHQLTVRTQKFDFIAFHFFKAHPSALKISP